LRQSSPGVISADHPTLGKTHLYCIPSPPPVAAEATEIEVEGESIVPDLLFTENDTNFERLYGGTNDQPYRKDAFHDHVIPEHRSKTRTSGSTTPTARSPTSFTPRHWTNPEKKGTKSAAHYVFENVPPRGGCAVVRLKLTPETPATDPAINDEEKFDDVIDERRVEADEFYNRLAAGPISDDLRAIMRQALGGMLWCDLFYFGLLVYRLKNCG
jgi:hypothetical protein